MPKIWVIITHWLNFIRWVSTHISFLAIRGPVALDARADVLAPGYNEFLILIILVVKLRVVALGAILGI